MMELYPDISEEVRQKTQFWLDMAFLQNVPKGLKMLMQFEETLTEHERDYVDMCFQLRLEEKYKDEENFSNQRQKRFR